MKPISLHERLLNEAIDDIEISETAFQKAEARYIAVGDWLERPDSRFSVLGVASYTQGSFALGTVIKPIGENEDYDIDLVCEWREDPVRCSPENVKKAIGEELDAYAKKHSMNDDIEECRRCWTLHYASSNTEPGFHMDVLPGIDPIPYDTRKSQFKVSGDFQLLKISITDNEDDNYARTGGGWLASNPRGYAAWFHGRQQQQRDSIRERQVGHIYLSVDAVPDFKVKTPLQRGVQFLKRHRDYIFFDDSEVKPISIIISTLAAHAYDNEDTVEGVIRSFITNCRSYIDQRINDDGRTIDWIANPINAEENFADKWPDNPDRREAFYFWLEILKHDFIELRNLVNIDASAKMRQMLQIKADARDHRRWQRRQYSHKLPIQINFNVGHRQAPTWQTNRNYSVRIQGEYRAKHGGHKWRIFRDASKSIPKEYDLRFTAIVDNVSRGRFKYKWQVVNTGMQAINANQLRGGFYAGRKQRRGRVRYESTEYSGKHWVQCFIFENNVCVGQSDEFVVSIE